MHTNALTILAIIAMVKVLQAKRFRKAVDRDEEIPANLIAGLKDTMATCQDMNPPLEVPPALQAQASLFVGKSNKEQTQQK